MHLLTLPGMFAGLAENRCLSKKPSGATLLQIGEQDVAFGAKFRARVVLDIQEHAEGTASYKPAYVQHKPATRLTIDVDVLCTSAKQVSLMSYCYVASSCVSYTEDVADKAWAA